MGSRVLKNYWVTKYTKMPGHWLLASLGKRVLRPGGLELSRWMIEELGISDKDSVVEFAPGLGRTAQLILEKRPFSYTGVEKSELAAAQARNIVSGPGRSIQIGDAAATGLPEGGATLACGEAFLTMQSMQVKANILHEIARILKPGGLYGLHELGLKTDSSEKAAEIHRDLSMSIHVNALPLSLSKWREFLESAGFEVIKVKTLPMALLEPVRLLKDEGFCGLLRIVKNLLLHPSALLRVLQMRKQFRRHSAELQAIGIIARKRKSTYENSVS